MSMIIKVIVTREYMVDELQGNDDLMDAIQDDPCEFFDGAKWEFEDVSIGERRKEAKP